MLRLSVMVLVFISIVSSCVGSVSKFGEICNNTDECLDHRYLCVPDEYNKFHCLCDRFHVWQGETIGCVQIYNATTIMNITVKEMLMKTIKVKKNFDSLRETTKLIIQTQTIAGLFVFAVVALVAFAVCIYCLYIQKTDEQLKKSVYKLKSKTNNIAPSVSPV